jgi:hypothetical protein
MTEPKSHEFWSMTTRHLANLVEFDVKIEGHGKEGKS